ncbi:MAG TPA: hypothetical protein VFB28_04340 [Terriglobales bacterium]|nr:hypothetical protein [Terriglobales bacterium]
MVPDQKFAELCREIAEQKDPKKLSSLCDQLLKLLHDEQDGIRTEIDQRLSRRSSSSG